MGSKHRRQQETGESREECPTVLRAKPASAQAPSLTGATECGKDTAKSTFTLSSSRP